MAGGTGLALPNGMGDGSADTVTTGTSAGGVPGDDDDEEDDEEEDELEDV